MVMLGIVGLLIFSHLSRAKKLEDQKLTGYRVNHMDVNINISLCA